MTSPSSNTQVFKLTADEPWDEALRIAATALQRGELVAFPTETVYGLGANALDAAAVERIFSAKGRPADNPLIVHIAAIEDLLPLVSSIPAVFYPLAAAFWPGPLTMIMPRSPLVPDVTTGGLDTVAIRLPSHPVAQALIRAAQMPIAAPSANRSGRPSPTLAQHVLADLQGQVAVLLDGGAAGVGVESTVLDLTAPSPTILRPGGVTLEDLTAVIKDVQLDARVSDVNAANNALPVRSPGMKYRHYAPLAPAVLVEGETPAIWKKMVRLLQIDQPQHPGLLVSEEGYHWFTQHPLPEGCEFVLLGKREQPETVAARLYAALRQLDDLQVDRIYMEGIAPRGMGLAVMNRMRRSAGGQIVKAEC
jgi:L-threonylcarbamoyladenylate synthase